MGQKEFSDALENSVLGQDPEAVIAAGKVMRIHHIRAGDVLMSEGDEADAVFLLVQGQLKVTLFASDGQEVWLDAPAPGDLVGEMAVLKGEALRSATVTARSQCDLIRFSRKDFLYLLQTFGKVGIALSSLLADRLQETSRRLSALAAEQIRDRLFAELVRISKTTGDDGWKVVSPALSQAELAQRTLSQRETVSRTLRKLENAGLVRRSGRQLFVRNVERVYPISDP